MIQIEFYRHAEGIDRRDFGHRLFGSLWYLIEFHGINLYDFWHECFNSPRGDSSECLRMSDHIIESLFKGIYSLGKD